MGDAGGAAYLEVKLDSRKRAERAAADRLPVLRLVTESAASVASGGGTRESAIADSTADPNVDSVVEPASGNHGDVADRALDLDALAFGLTRLGLPAARSRRILSAALEALPHGEITEAGVLRRALASI